MATTFSHESFLDLKFNNHWVSEYGLVVVSDGSRNTEILFPEFNHTTTTVPGKTGTVYWGTVVSGRTITKKLATDGMTSRQYASFRVNFKPGTYAELRFAESAYKYGFAYINETSAFTFVPFESTVTIAGVSYKDTLYKGECDLTFFMPDPYFYSDYYLGSSNVSPIFNYTTEDWFIESGLPITTWLALEGGNIQLALGNWYGTAPTSATTIKCYHAGNATARANLNFQKTYGTLTDGALLTGLWTNYEINDIILTEPRIIKDIRYIYTYVDGYIATWTASGKAIFLLDLQENLDSSIAGVLRRMVTATGTGLLYSDIPALKTGIRNVFINGKTYLLSINGIELQARILSNPLVNMVDPTDSSVFVVDDNMIDSLNNKYITLSPSSGATADGQLTYTTITSSVSLLNPEVYFRNTYE